MAPIQREVAGIIIEAIETVAPYCRLSFTSYSCWSSNSMETKVEVEIFPMEADSVKTELTVMPTDTCILSTNVEWDI